MCWGCKTGYGLWPDIQRSFRPTLVHEEGESSLSDLVIAICKDNAWKSVGSSAPKRHQVCTQRKPILEWKNVGPPALKVIDKFNRENRNRHCISDKDFEKLLKEVEKLPLMGNVTSHHIFPLCSFVWLDTLWHSQKCYAIQSKFQGQRSQQAYQRLL